MDKELKNQMIINYINNIANSLEEKKIKVTDDQKKEVISMFIDSEKELVETKKEIDELVNKYVEDYIKRQQYTNKMLEAIWQKKDIQPNNMTQYKKLLLSSQLIGGIVNIDQQGNVSFERLSDIESIEKALSDGKKIGYATKTMGRSIFVEEDGKIINYKGVDSNLGEQDNVIAKMQNTNIAAIPNPINNDSKIFIMSEPDKNGKRRYEIRFMGKSPLEDIVIEAGVNSNLKKMGVKVPKIKRIFEYSDEYLMKNGLPIKRKGDYLSLKSNANYSMDYYVNDIDGIETKFNHFLKDERPELLSEYFLRLGLDKTVEFQKFLINEGEGVTIEDVLASVDNEYALGQRYGQAVRELESPYRIADIEFLIKNENYDALKSIIDYTQNRYLGKYNFFEEEFADTLGKNMALLFNNGYSINNFLHRQDYSLAAEMCDDSYYNILDKLNNISKEKDIYKRNYSRNEIIKKYIQQLVYMSSNIKILEKEMNLRGINSNLTNIYVNSIVNNLDINNVANLFGISKDSVIEKLNSELNKNDILMDMAKSIGKDSNGKPIDTINDAILNSSKGNEVYYQEVAKSLSEGLNRKYSSKLDNDDKTKKYCEDLDYLSRALETIHPDLYRKCSKEDIQKSINDLKESNLNEKTFKLGIMKILSKIGDPHTTVDIESNPDIFKYKFIDNKLYILDDYVNENSKYINNEITAINNVPIKIWINKLSEYVSYDNEACLKKNVAELLNNASFMKEIANSDKLIYSCNDGVNLNSFDFVNEAQKEIIKKETKLQCDNIDDDTMYIKYKTCIDNQENNLQNFIAEANYKLEESMPQNVIVDLRGNKGGNSMWFKSMLNKLVNIPNKTTLVDENTFSSGVIAMNDMKSIGSKIVGEEVSLAENHFGNCKNFMLPNTKTNIWCSTAEFVKNNDKLVQITKEEKVDNDNVKVTAYGNQQTIVPKQLLNNRSDFKLDNKITPSINDYKISKDPVLDSVKKSIPKNNLTNTQNNTNELSKPKTLTLTKKNSNSPYSNQTSGYINLFILTLLTGFAMGVVSVLTYMFISSR